MKVFKSMFIKEHTRLHLHNNVIILKYVILNLNTNNMHLEYESIDPITKLQQHYKSSES